MTAEYIGVGWEDKLRAENAMLANWISILVNLTPERSWEMIHRWCKKNCRGEFSWSGNTFFFKNNEDATYFALRWS